MLERTDYLDPAKVPAGKRTVVPKSPNVGDIAVIEQVPIKTGKYEALPRGSPHPDYDINGLVLVYEDKVKAENNQIVARRVYAKPNTVEDWYNYVVKYASETDRIFIRTYTMRRSDYTEAPAFGDPFTGVYQLKVTAAGANYTTPPTVGFSGGAGSGAAANPIMSPPDENGKMKVIGLELTNEGAGYTSAPAIAFTGGGGGSGAAAVALIQPAAAVLVKEETAKLENDDPQIASLFIRVTRVYGYFNEKVRSIGTPNVVPERFRATDGFQTVEDTVPGVVPDTVLLGAGEVERTESQLEGGFLKRVKRVLFNLGLLPTLHGQDYDRRAHTVVPWTEKVEASGTSLGDDKTEIQPLSSALDLTKIYDTASLLGVSKIYQGPLVSLDLPPVLEGINVSYESRNGAGQFTGDVGDCHWFDAGSWSYTLRGEGQGSAAITPHISYSVKRRGWGKSPTTRVVFFLSPPNTSINNVLDKLTALLGSTINGPIAMAARGFSIALISEAVSLSAEAQEHVQDGGSDTAEEHSEYGGHGDSRQRTLNREIINIPECLHSGISINSSSTASATASAVAGFHSSSPGGETITGRAIASAAATTPSDVPGSGFYLHDLHSEVFYDVIMYIADVVDMATA